jgi:hypothetical protein
VAKHHADSQLHLGVFVFASKSFFGGGGIGRDDYMASREDWDSSSERYTLSLLIAGRREEMERPSNYASL